MSNGSHESTTPFSPVSFPVDQQWQELGLWPSSLGEVQGALDALERAWIPAKLHDETTCRSRASNVVSRQRPLLGSHRLRGSKFGDPGVSDHQRMSPEEATDSPPTFGHT